MGAWHERPFMALDIETTGLNWRTDRIVQVGYAIVQPDGEVECTWSTVVDPGIEIPDESTAIHGITTQRAREDGIATDAALSPVAAEIADGLATYQPDGMPVVMFNAGFDWPFIVSESARCRVPFPVGASILDPYVIDGMISRRRGSRKLVDQCRHYEVPFDGDAHDAAADALAAGRLMRRLVEVEPKLTEHTLASLYLRQAQGAEQRRASYVDWRRSQGDASFDSHAGWPIPAGVSA